MRTGGVLPQELVHDPLSELPLEVEDVVGDAQHIGGGAGLLRVIYGAAALVVARRLAVLEGPQPHRDAHDVVPLLHEQAGGDGGVDPSGHGDDDARFRHFPSML